MFYQLLKYPLRWRVNSKIVPNTSKSKHASSETDVNHPIFYVVRHQSASDILTLSESCKKLNLPDPLQNVCINGTSFQRTICLSASPEIFCSHSKKDHQAIKQGLDLLHQHSQNPQLNAQLIPANIIWGRKPQKNKWHATENTHHNETPPWWKKLLIVLFRGGHTLVRLSDAISFREMVDNHGSDEKSARKLLRIARFHFYKQNIAAKGPRALSRAQVFKLLLANPAIQTQIAKEVESKKISPAQANKEALKMMEEIAGDYHDVMIRFGERILGWLWKKLYRDIEVSHNQELQKIAQAGHEILYVPCHRSHMDYLLLTYIIFHQGLVTPRIAAGINLNFWPAGPIFRKSGAFFIRRSFKGNRLYSTIFSAYLSLLFERGYPVKYYTEGGRSRTGKLLPPKTGMISMTIQSLLKGIERPLSIVPVYLGYEHVMEVASYHKELSGADKKSESLLSVFKAIRNLRNYGRGYVNFGKPINLHKFLTQQEPNWKADIQADNNSKPPWLTEKANLLSKQIMVAINENTALNGVSLVALTLLSTSHKALPKDLLESHLNFLLDIQKLAPFNSRITLPSCTQSPEFKDIKSTTQSAGETLLNEVIALNKISVNKNEKDIIFSLSSAESLDMRYYRNNILHTYLVPALICKLLAQHAKIKSDDLQLWVENIIRLFSNEFFIYPAKKDIIRHTQACLSALLTLGLTTLTKAGYYALTTNAPLKFNASLLGECINESLQRLMILTSIFKLRVALNKAQVADKSRILAKRLEQVNNIEVAEFNDGKAQESLLQSLQNNGYLETTQANEYRGSDTLIELHNTLSILVSNQVQQTLNISEPE